MPAWLREIRTSSRAREHAADCRTRVGPIALCLAVLLSLVAGPGRAQAQSPPSPGAITVTRVDFGLGGSLVPERWQPVVVWIASDRALDGVVSIEFQQDGSQASRVEAAFATTPGRTIPVELAMAPPRRLQRMTLRVSGGPRDIRRTYTPAPQDEREFLMPPVIDTQILIARLGDTGGTEVLSTLARLTLDQVQVAPEGDALSPTPPPDVQAVATEATRLDRWRQRVVAPTIDPATAPIAWLSWDSAAAVIVRATTLESMDTRRRAALLTWLESGGRLVVLMDPGTAWTLAAAFPDAPLPVEAGAIERWDVAGPGLLDLAVAQRPSELRGRAMRLTPTGQRDGWRLGWTVARPGEPARGMLATGPVGMGVVTLLGVEPASVPRLVSIESERDLWQQVLTGTDVGLLPEHRTPRGSEEDTMGAWWYYGSGDDSAGASSVTAALDFTAAELAVPQGVFVLVGLSMVGLALLVGPLDFFVFRRRGLGGRTWLTAMIWIGVATVGAYVLPDLARTVQSTVRRVEVLDLLAIDHHSAQASTEARAGAGPFALRAYESSITGIFSVRPESWEEPDPVAGRAWRGVSSTPLGFGGESALSVFRPVRARITGSEGDVALRRTTLAPIDMPQWTFRGLMDAAPGRPHALTLEVLDPDSQETTIRLRGLAPDAVLVRAALLRPWDSAIIATRAVAGAGGAIDVTFETDSVTSSSPRSSPSPSPGSSPGSGTSSGATGAGFIGAPGAAWSGFSSQAMHRLASPEGRAFVDAPRYGALPGLRERNAAIERRVHQFEAIAPEDGRAYACLFLELHEGASQAPTLRTSEPARFERTTLCRVIIPWVRQAPARPEPRPQMPARPSEPERASP